MNRTDDSDAVYALECEGKYEEAEYVRGLEAQLAELRKHAHAMATSVGCTSKAFRDYWDYVEQQEVEDE